MTYLKQVLVAAATAAVLGAATPVLSAELILNGDFEAGLTNWTAVGQVGANTAANYGPCCGTTGGEPAYSGNHFAAFGSGNIVGLSSLSQIIGTVAGASYNLSFLAGAFGANTNVVVTSAGGATNSFTVTANNNANTTFSSHAFSFLGSGVDTITFSVNSPPSDNTDALIDNVSVIGQAPTAVPEPAAWALMIMGFGGVGALVRRRRWALARA